MELKELLDHLKNGVNAEIKGAQKLEDEKLNRFCEIFNVPEDADLFYTPYNFIITEKEVFEALEHYMKPSQIVMRIEIPSFNVFIIVYQYVNDALFDNYLYDG